MKYDEIPCVSVEKLKVGGPCKNTGKVVNDIPSVVSIIDRTPMRPMK